MHTDTTYLTLPGLAALQRLRLIILTSLLGSVICAKQAETSGRFNIGAPAAHFLNAHASCFAQTLNVIKIKRNVVGLVPYRPIQRTTTVVGLSATLWPMVSLSHRPIIHNNAIRSVVQHNNKCKRQLFQFADKETQRETCYANHYYIVKENR